MIPKDKRKIKAFQDGLSDFLKRKNFSLLTIDPLISKNQEW